MNDCRIMIKRCMRISFRNVETLIMATLTPFFLMLLFGTVFGDIADVGGYHSYIDFIVSGIILQAVSQGAQYAAININHDMNKGIIDRFRAMSMNRLAVLAGHAAASVVRSMITTAVIIATGLLVGFRPQGGALALLMAAGIFVLFGVAISWLAVLFGLLSKTAEGSAGYLFPFFILPFVSSGFAPIDTLPRWLRTFAQYQPMTPIIDATRGLMLDMPLNGSLLPALAWCIGIAIFSCIAALQVYKRKCV
ncbi:MAG: ABC transporter permease [Defluviitaleaceae bacterium]|nr:ABC transporter permease [Defluviitaleaceae bacterium]MCL2276008.1 ABC transporter permease [Defluviitaleaceae bacterium]